MRKILITSIAVIASLNILAQGYRWALCFPAFMPTQVCVQTERTLSTEVIGGFTGRMVGLFAQGEDGDGYADFDWFEYTTE